MAFAVTARHSGNSGETGVQTQATDSQTPTADSLLLVASVAQNDNHNATQVAIDPTGGGWTYDLVEISSQVAFAATGAAFGLKGILHSAQVGGSPSAHTITVDHYTGTDAASYAVACVDVTGHDPADPIVQSKVNAENINPASNSADGTVTLDGTPEVGNLVVVTFLVGEDAASTIAAPTIGGQSMTELHNQSASFAKAGVWYREITGAESNNVILSTDLGEDVGHYAAVAVEVRAAPPAEFERTNLLSDSTSEGHGSGSFVTDAFVPPDNSLLVVAVGVHVNGGSADPTGDMTISGGGWTYTPQESQGTTGESFALGLKIYTAPVTTGASMSLTLDCGSIDILSYQVSVVAYTEYDTGDPVGGVGSDLDTTAPDGAETFDLDAAPAATSETFAALLIDKETIGTTPGTGWIDVHETQVGTSAGLHTQVREPGSTSPTVDWVDVHTGGSNSYKSVVAAIEIKAAGDEPPPPTGPYAILRPAVVA